MDLNKLFSLNIRILLSNIKKVKNMENRTGQKWSREETILAFELYCRTPFSKITKTNKDIIKLAKLLGRSPSSVGLKMANLAHFDPEIQRRNLSGMAHGSKLDKDIYEEFANDWETLYLESQRILADKKKISFEEMIDLRIESELILWPKGEYYDAQVKLRMGQYFFRTVVLNAYSNKCCVTGLKAPQLLIASHIKPWCVSDIRTERTNPCNGLCLNALHDKAFDRGLITLSKNYEMIISSKLKKIEMDNDTRKWFMQYEHQKISLPDKFMPDKKFIEYHNDMIFQG